MSLLHPRACWNQQGYDFTVPCETSSSFATSIIVTVPQISTVVVAPMVPTSNNVVTSFVTQMLGGTVRMSTAGITAATTTAGRSSASGQAGEETWETVAAVFIVLFVGALVGLLLGWQGWKRYMKRETERKKLEEKNRGDTGPSTTINLTPRMPNETNDANTQAA